MPRDPNNPKGRAFREKYFGKEIRRDGDVWERVVAEVDEWAVSPPPGIRMWMDANGITEIPLGPADRRGIDKAVKREGYAEYRKQWMSEACRNLTKVLGARKQGSFRELLWRVVQMRLFKSKEALRNLTASESDDIARYLGADEAYVYSHPGLCLDDVDAEDPVVKAILGNYESSQKPSRGALNMYRHVRENPAYREKFLAGCISQAAKKRTEVVKEQAADPEEEEGIDALKDVIRKLRSGANQEG